MIPKGCKRLAEVDFPIAEVSRHAARDWPAAWQARAGETKPRLQEPIEDLARLGWSEVHEVAYYHLPPNVITQQMRVREDEAQDGRRE